MKSVDKMTDTYLELLDRQLGKDGESVTVQGSGSKPYVLKNTGGVYSCSCPAWRNQSTPIERRTCKHLRKIRGEAAETTRIGNPLPAASAEKKEGPPLLLAESWDGEQDLTGWWMSEKLDGVRAYWDGKTFISRLGNEYKAPGWFTENLPNIPLDGELWIGRKLFQRTVSIVRRQDRSGAWDQIKYCVFDAPTLELPFEARLIEIKTILRKSGAKFASRHLQETCAGIAHLESELAAVEAGGGEGLMFRQPASMYEVGRSSTLLKVKTFHDAEAVVVAHEPGKGKHKGRLGAVTVETPEGIRFSVGTGFTDAERENPPPIGSTITYRYQELSTDKVPRFPSYLRLRDE